MIDPEMMDDLFKLIDKHGGTDEAVPRIIASLSTIIGAHAEHLTEVRGLKACARTWNSVGHTLHNQGRRL